MKKKCLTNLQGGYLCDIIHIEKEKERMLKKLFLTGIFVVSTSVPVLSYGDYITNSSSCDYATLNTYTSANLSAVFEPNNYTITYSCGSAPQGSASTPSSPTTSSSTFTMDTPYTLAAANNCSLPGYTFAGWSCPNLPGTPTLPVAPATPLYFAGGATGTYSYAGNITCTAQWTPNNIALHWDSAYTGAPNINDSSCEYDGGITLPTPPPSRTGYTFGGWRVHQCVLSDYYTTELPDYDPQHVRWETETAGAATMATEFHDNTLISGLQPGEWGITFSTGELKGTSLCSATDGTGTYDLYGTPNLNQSGDECWCRPTSFGNSCNFDSSAWIHISSGDCESCAYYCALMLSRPDAITGDSSSVVPIRQALFGVTTP